MDSPFSMLLPDTHSSSASHGECQDLRKEILRSILVQNLCLRRSEQRTTANDVMQRTRWDEVRPGDKARCLPIAVQAEILLLQ